MTGRMGTSGKASVIALKASYIVYNMSSQLFEVASISAARPCLHKSPIRRMASMVSPVAASSLAAS